MRVVRVVGVKPRIGKNVKKKDISYFGFSKANTAVMLKCVCTLHTRIYSYVHVHM